MLKDKIILITGGCGTLGQAVTTELLEYNPKAIRLFDNSEYFHWHMKRKFTDPRLRFQIGDIRDRNRLFRAMTGVDIVIHTAALKHVDLAEYNPIEAVRTNIEGSINVIDTAIDQGVNKVLAISSDKAVHPINIYGATKLVMEKLIIQGNIYGDTQFSCARFGNFEGSRGSLVSVIEQQLEQGNEVTITDKEMTRFWITIDKASKFVVECIEIMKGGEIFIPKMSEASVTEVIRTLAPGAQYKIIGRRPGEKLHELLFNEDEVPVDCGDYFVIRG